jgi:glycosyltransferase involved in cell wall biosynthesis
LRSKACAIYQCAKPTGLEPRLNHSAFEVAVLGHLRYEKDPLRTALALRLLPASLPIRVTHLGQALSPAMEKRARAAAARDPRYRWQGEVSRARARRILARSHLLVLTSRMEGGANVISEALADHVPVISSRIPGSEGILGTRYPGFFPVGDSDALAGLLRRAATESSFYDRLKRWCTRLAPLVEPWRERRAWEHLLAELVPLKSTRQKKY